MLGNALLIHGDARLAAEAQGEAIRINPVNAVYHSRHGLALREWGDADAAVRAYQQAVSLDAAKPLYRCDLGLAYRRAGQLTKAVGELQRGHGLGSRDPAWELPSGRWLSDTERYAKLELKLPQYVANVLTPASRAERIDLAVCAQYTKEYTTAVRFYREAFAEGLEPSPDKPPPHRYDAACAAAQAGCGFGKDPPASESAREASRRQALEWLQADLSVWRRLAAENVNEQRNRAARKLRHWRCDLDLTGIRDHDRVRQLGKSEQEVLGAFWEEVDAVLSHAKGKR